MKYAKLSCIEFYSCHLQQCPSIDLFSYRTPGQGQKGHMIRSVCPSVRNLSWNWLFSFSGTQHDVRGPCGVVHGSQNVQESFFFFSILYFFLNLVYNESLWYCNCCMLEQISYLGKFWFVRYGPKSSWAIRLQDFSINWRILKLAVSHEKINGINCFLVCPSNSFLRNGSLGFTDFWHNGRYPHKKN